MGDTEWLSTTEAARRLAVTSRAVYSFINDGSLPGYRFGRVIRIKEAALAAFIDACWIEPGTLRLS